MLRWLVVLSVIFLCIAPAGAEPSAIVKNYRQVQYERLRRQIMVMLCTDFYLASGAMTSDDINNLNDNVDQKSLGDMAQHRMAVLEDLNKMITSLGGQPLTDDEIDSIQDESVMNCLLITNQPTAGDKK